MWVDKDVSDVVVRSVTKLSLVGTARKSVIFMV